MKKTVLKVVILLVAVFMALSVGAQQVKTEWPITLEWDENLDVKLKEYRMYTSRVSGVYTYGSYIGVIPKGTHTFDYTITEPGEHFFVVSARDEEGNESAFSNEVVKDADGTAPPACTGLRIK